MRRSAAEQNAAVISEDLDRLDRGIRAAARALGRKGGQVTGQSKRRGDASGDHYRALQAASAERRRVRWQREGETGGVTIKAAPTGWVVDSWSRVTGERTLARVLVSYEAAGYDRDADLSAPINEHLVERGEYIARMAADGDGTTLRKGINVR